MIKCKVCKYWDKQSGDTGFCRILPPVTNDILLKAVWPMSMDTDSCGQGEPYNNLK